MTDRAKGVAYNALRQMYMEAEPPLSFDHVLANPDEYDDRWFEQHELDSERQSEIVEEHLEDADLSDREETQVTMTAILHYGPTSARTDGGEENWMDTHSVTCAICGGLADERGTVNLTDDDMELGDAMQHENPDRYNAILSAVDEFGHGEAHQLCFAEYMEDQNGDD